MMTSQTSIMLSLPASCWPVMVARVEGYVRPDVNVTKRNRQRLQGCFPMTD